MGAVISCQHTGLRKYQPTKWVFSTAGTPKAKKEGFNGDRAVPYGSQKANATQTQLGCSCNPKRRCSRSMTSSWTYIFLSKTGCPGNMTILVSSALPCNSFEVKISFSDKVSLELWFKIPTWCGFSTSCFRISVDSEEEASLRLPCFCWCLPVHNPPHTCISSHDSSIFSSCNTEQKCHTALLPSGDWKSLRQWSSELRH